jgi:hypothetical protein
MWFSLIFCRESGECGFFRFFRVLIASVSQICGVSVLSFFVDSVLVAGMLAGCGNVSGFLNEKLSGETHEFFKRSRRKPHGRPINC